MKSSTGWRNQFLGILEKVIKSKSSDFSEFIGFVIPHQDYVQVEKIIKSNLMPDFSDLRFIPSSIKPGPENKCAGSFFSLKKDQLIEAEKSELKEAKVIVSPGLGGGDSEKQLKYSIEEFRRIFPDAVVYSPLKDGQGRESRYIEGLHYYQNENYINLEESNNFFAKIILPKITDKDGNLLKPEEIEKFTLAGFSIGSRENRSHLEYTYEFLLSKGVAEAEIPKYFDRISVVNIGSPVNWSSLRVDSIPIFTTNILSATDMGTRKPDSLMRAIYLDPECHDNDSSFFYRPNSTNNHLIVLGNNYVPVVSQRVVNKLGHDLAAYIDAVIKNKEITEILEFHRDSSQGSFAKEKIKDVISKKREFKYDKNLNPEGVEALVDSWANHMSLVVAEIAKKDKKKKKSNEIPSGSVCGDGDVIDAEKLKSKKESYLRNEGNSSR
ncbi:MAG: hypothetical protein FJ368_01665 [Pelagibacterales bacterium]|nr:hypothetical protein [Pelagibacterales bacterium]